MRKKLLYVLGIVMATSMLFGCNPGNPGQVPGSGNPTNTVQNTSNVSSKEDPAMNEATNLTAGKGGLEIEKKAPEAGEINALSGAAVNLFGEVLKNDPRGNVLLSPISISMALGMTENGADGETLKQMQDTVNGGLTAEEMNKIMAYTSDKLNHSDFVTWKSANSIWFKDDGLWEMKDEFLNKTVSYYNAEVWKAPFDDSTLKDINGWIENKTDGMIPNALDEIKEDARMYLINGLAFEGKWMEQFEDYQVGEDVDFTNADGTKSKVTMLYGTENRYFTLGDGEGFLKYYEGGQYAFVGILPKEGIECSDYIQKIASDGESFAEAVKNAEYQDVNIMMPEFSLDYGIELKDTYKAMGMENPFDAGAEFDKMMAPVSGEDLNIWIERIIHKTHLELDRNGTSAAAATIVEVAVEGCVMEPEEPREVYLDRPFVYAIVDTETGLPMFLGCQNFME